MQEVIHNSFYNINIKLFLQSKFAVGMLFHNLKNEPLCQKQKQNGLEASKSGNT